MEEGPSEPSIAAPRALDQFAPRLRVLCILALVSTAGPFFFALLEPGLGILPACCLALPFVVAPAMVLMGLDASSRKPLGNAGSMTALGVYAPIISVLGVSARPPLWGGLQLWSAGFVIMTLAFWTLRWTIRHAVAAGWPAGPSRAWVSTLLAITTGPLFFLWSLQWARPAANESAALATLRTIDGALAKAKAVGCGVPRTLAALATSTELSSDGANLAEQVRQGNSFVRANYSYEYSPGPLPADASKGCGAGAGTYTLTARPLSWGASGRTSFLTDGTSAIHLTQDNRPATVADPAR
jgi:hypothetical protein